MKRLILISLFLIVSSNFVEASTPAHLRAHGIFYSHLSPYGTWMQFDDGLVVWRPLILKRSWAPYSIGRWIWTDYGWYWDSYEPFGYITYHYGRWYYDDYYGWIWIPDYDWAPAWVEWRYDDAYIGWAPLPPYAVFSINVGIHFTFNFVTPYYHWNFVSYNYMCDPYVYKHYVGPKYKYRVFSNTKYRNDYGYSDGRIVNRGIDVKEIRSRSGQDIQVRNIQSVSDHRELTSKERTRNNGAVKTFIVSREDLQRERIENTDLRRVGRNSSLDTEKLQLGDRRDRQEGLGIKKRDDDSRTLIKHDQTRDIQTRDKRRIEMENHNLDEVGKNREDETERNFQMEKKNIERKHEENKLMIERQQTENSSIENTDRRNNRNDSRNDDKSFLKETGSDIRRNGNEEKYERKTETRSYENRTTERNDGNVRTNRSNDNKKIEQDRKTTERTRNR